MARSRLTRRELLRSAGASGVALGTSVLLAPALAGQNQSQAPAVKPGQEPKTESQAASNYAHPPGVFINRPLTQISKEADALLDDMEGRGCDFFYEQASPKTGLVRDRAPAAGRSLSRVASIAATGFGLSALCIAAKRNYLRPLDCEQRVEKTLAFLLEDCPHEHGFLYHFIDIDSGQRMFNSELSSIDTALAALRGAALQGVFRGKRAHPGAGHDLLPADRLAVDAQWRRHAVHGLAARPGVPDSTAGTFMPS